MNLESDLKHALRRESPPAGFAGRVMARIEQAEQPRRRPVWWRAAAASVTLAILLGGYGTHRAYEQRKGERAREELLRAMSIASEKVKYAQDEVRGIGSGH